MPHAEHTPFEFRGPLAIAGFLEQTHFWGQETKLVPARANGQPAFVFYLADPCAPIWRGDSLVVLTLRGNQVSVITRFGDRGRPRS
jgi:RNA polymerase sigma-70 factor (ECF subfamily)